MARSRQCRGESGFTLVELMVSLTVLSVAIAAAFALAFSLMNGFRDHRRAVNVESSTRIVLDILASGVRAASPGIVSGEVWNPCTGLPVDTITVINSTTAADQLEVIHALGGAYASLPPVPPPNGTQDISSGTIVVDDSRLFETGMWVPAIIVEPGTTTSKAHLVEVFATAANSTTMSVRSPGGCPATWTGTSAVTATDYDPVYDGASFVLRAIHVRYSVVPPLLWVDPDGPGALPAQVMAEGIEDLQIAVGIEDGTDTGSLSETVAKTDDEWFYNDPGDVLPVPLISAGGWRALRITVVGVDSRETRQDGVNLRPAVEDRAAATVKDPYRRRVFSTSVQLRNFESGQ